MQEIEWREVPDSSGRYLVSNTGLIKVTANQAKRKERIRKPHSDMYGYQHLCMLIGGVVKSVKVHRLVAKTFIPNPHNKPQVNHKDLNPSNNHVDNLEWVTNDENQAHRKEHKKFLPKHSGLYWTKKIAKSKVDYENAVDALLSNFLNRSKAAESLGISKVTLMKRIRVGKNLLTDKHHG